MQPESSFHPWPSIVWCNSFKLNCSWSHCWLCSELRCTWWRIWWHVHIITIVIIINTIAYLGLSIRRITMLGGAEDRNFVKACLETSGGLPPTLLPTQKFKSQFCISNSRINRSYWYHFSSFLILYRFSQSVFQISTLVKFRKNSRIEPISRQSYLHSPYTVFVLVPLSLLFLL